MLKFTFLSREFYADYRDCKEIETKEFRPHVQVTIEINDVLFCVPMRSNINHPHVFWTDKERKCGLDFSKAVAIKDKERYLNKVMKPFVRTIEFDALRGKDFIVKQKMIKYISDYKKAKANLNVRQNQMLVRFSTLQYFEDVI